MHKMTQYDLYHLTYLGNEYYVETFDSLDLLTEWLKANAFHEYVEPDFVIRDNTYDLVAKVWTECIGELVMEQEGYPDEEIICEVP